MMSPLLGIIVLLFVIVLTSTSLVVWRVVTPHVRIALRLAATRVGIVNPPANSKKDDECEGV